MPVPSRPNRRWSLDLLPDMFGACRKFRILAVNDDCCRENLTLIADTSISGPGWRGNLTAPRPARLPNPKPTTINPKDSRYERGTNGGRSE